MPFTLAHPIAVVPLRRLGLPIGALSIGAMVPDLPLFVRVVPYSNTHSLPGIVTTDLIVGVLALLLWYGLVRAPVWDAAPALIRARLPDAPRLNPGRWPVVLLALVLGSGTHVLWDEFTHARRWGWRNLEWLRADHGGLYGFQWLQYGCTVLGLAGLAWLAIIHLRRAPVSAARRLVPGAWLVWAVPLVTTCLVAAAQLPARDLHSAAFFATTRGMTAAAAALLCLCVVWWLARLVGALRTKVVGPAANGRERLPA